MSNESLQEALDAYFDHFGKNYPIVVSRNNGTAEEIAETIRKCIENDTPAPEPEYRDDRDY